ncbi:zingiberene synthase-like [Hordeum vulgare subsp. vulgare]|nr:zingiberene synthase-like [Hordeum vulgare subsp. vulgare]
MAPETPARSSTEGARKASLPPPTFHPSLWGGFFLTYKPPTAPQCACMEEKAEVLKEEVRKIVKNTHELSKLLDLIMTLQRLGLDIYYENDINELLHSVYKSDYNEEDLHLVSLRFYLLRTNGYDVSADVFLRFKDDEGNFMFDDTRSILSLYNAAYLRTHGERVLDEAIIFTTSHLEGVLQQSSPLANEISLALETPLFRRARIVEMRSCIHIYDNDATKNDAMLEFAKLNFNLLQLLYCEELNKITLWWKELHDESKLGFSRDRIVEMYFWMNGACYEPQYSNSRIILTKITAFMTILDDIFDTYGTTEESMQLAEAINRWNGSATELLPSYIKGFYLYLLKTFDSFEYELGPGKSHHVHYLKEALMRLVQAYTEELKWRDGNYVPKTLDEHLGVSARSSGGFTLASASLFAGVGGIATTDTFEWILNYPQLFKTFDMFVRFSNDIVSSQREQVGDHYASTIQCYMEEHGATLKDALKKIKDHVEDSWKDMVRHCVTSTEQQQPLAVPWTVVNFARTVNNMYKRGDAFTSSHEIKEMITLLYVEPIY